MRIKRPEVVLDSIQIKSLKTARLLAKALNTIEEECGIHETWITLVNPFICPWIDLDQLNKTPMEELLQGLLKKHKKKNA